MGAMRSRTRCSRSARDEEETLKRPAVEGPESAVYADGAVHAREERQKDGVAQGGFRHTEMAC